MDFNKRGYAKKLINLIDIPVLDAFSPSSDARQAEHIKSPSNLDRPGLPSATAADAIESFQSSPCTGWMM